MVGTRPGTHRLVTSRPGTHRLVTSRDLIDDATVTSFSRDFTKLSPLCDGSLGAGVSRLGAMLAKMETKSNIRVRLALKMKNPGLFTINWNVSFV